ncbi:MAG TPA: hypothetical protein VHE61_07295, partial [Opitutaceae bacterium]|nr:hypothetical protein [Opitutaceae bacterium]
MTPALAELVRDVHVQASALLPVKGVRIQVNRGSSTIVPEVGVGGSCFNRDLVSVDVRPDVDLSAEPARRAVQY